jgi:hypothetical protein
VGSLRRIAAGRSWRACGISVSHVRPRGLYWSTERLIEFAAPTSRRISIRDSVGQYISAGNHGSRAGRAERDRRPGRTPDSLCGLSASVSDGRGSVLSLYYQTERKDNVYRKVYFVCEVFDSSLHGYVCNFRRRRYRPLGVVSTQTERAASRGRNHQDQRPVFCQSESNIETFVTPEPAYSGMNPTRRSSNSICLYRVGYGSDLLFCLSESDVTAVRSHSVTTPPA